MNKKGELTTQQIVMLIILIASFAVILFFIFRLGLGEEQEREVCHNSVLMKGNALIPDEAAPLNCKKQYVCISADKTCEGMTDPILKKVKTKNETFEALAEEMADCWWMFGEGNVNYAGKEIRPQLHCALCSQIYFDNSMSKIFAEGKFSEEELYDYLAIEEYGSSKESYSMYMYGSNEIKQLAQNFNLDFRDIRMEEYYYVLTGMTSVFGGKEVDAIGGGIGLIVGTALTYATGGTGGVALKLVKGVLSKKAFVGGVVGSTGAHFIAPIFKNRFGAETIRPSLIEVNSDEFKNLNCKELATYA